MKGNTTYNIDKNNMTVWDANSGDIHYQGTSSQPLPVDVSISYMLDGKSVTADEIKGKSGKAVIRFDYANTQCQYVEINGEKTKIYVPFVMLSGMIVDNSVFSNVTVSNGKMIAMGDNTIIVGFAIPGMQESLEINEEDMKIPDYIDITADVKKFQAGKYSYPCYKRDVQ